MYKIIFSMLVLVSTISSPCSPSKNSVSTSSENSTIDKDYLTENTWLVEELTYLQNDQLGNYQRDTYSDQFRNDRIKFNKDGTGLYTNTYHQKFKTTWAFSDVKKRKINLVIYDYYGGGPSEGNNQHILMENVTVSANSLSYSEIYHSSANTTMTSVYRIPVKE